MAGSRSDLDAALLHARGLVSRYPADPQFRALLLELEKAKAH